MQSNQRKLPAIGQQVFIVDEDNLDIVPAWRITSETENYIKFCTVDYYTYYTRSCVQDNNPISTWFFTVGEALEALYRLVVPDAKQKCIRGLNQMSEFDRNQFLLQEIKSHY